MKFSNQFVSTRIIFIDRGVISKSTHRNISEVAIKMPEEMLAMRFSSWYRQARNQLRTPEGRRVFWERLKLFKLCLIVSNYVQHIFPWRMKNTPP